MEGHAEREGQGLLGIVAHAPDGPFGQSEANGVVCGMNSTHIAS